MRGSGALASLLLVLRADFKVPPSLEMSRLYVPLGFPMAMVFVSVKVGAVIMWFECIVIVVIVVVVRLSAIFSVN